MLESGARSPEPVQCLTLRDRRRSTIPGNDSMIVNAIIPTTAFPSAWLAIAAHGAGNVRSSSSTYNPMNTAACSDRRRQEHHEARQRRGDDELLADDARPRTRRSTSPARRCRSTPLESASWMMPATLPGQHPAHRTGRQRDVDHDDEHQIERRGAADQETRQRRLQRERQRYRDQNAGGLHCADPCARAPIAAPGSAFSIASPAASARPAPLRAPRNRPPAGRRSPLNSPAPRSTDSI